MVTPLPTVKVLTDNTSETILVRWDGARFVLMTEKMDSPHPIPKSVIILNPREMQDQVDFAVPILNTIKEGKRCQRDIQM